MFRNCTDISTKIFDCITTEGAYAVFYVTLFLLLQTYLLTNKYVCLCLYNKYPKMNTTNILS